MAKRVKLVLSVLRKSRQNGSNVKEKSPKSSSISAKTSDHNDRTRTAVKRTDNKIRLSKNIKTLSRR
jgi:hypothetical protein